MLKISKKLSKKYDPLSMLAYIIYEKCEFYEFTHIDVQYHS